MRPRKDPSVGKGKTCAPRSMAFITERPGMLSARSRFGHLDSRLARGLISPPRVSLYCWGFYNVTKV